ncbi:DNA primase [Francisella sp. W12-1067]|nr:DNA primase [Francisella sp. W12-1067]
MTKRVSNIFIKDLISSVDIVDVISRFVKLKKSGKNYKGCCPFHNEKTPSFFVTPDKNFFHCFGCQESGDTITFIKKVNNLDFIDAVKNLAEMIGKPIEYENHSQEDIQQEQLYNKCISFLETAQKYYRWSLGNSSMKDKAIDYLKKRAISSELAKFFGIGYACDGWDNIIQLAKKAKLTDDILIETGLVVQKDNGNIYDRFRKRIMFPIRNIQGNVIAYGGRVLDDKDGVKYINSPETLIFQKNNILYGLYEYRQFKKQQKNVSESLVVVEGYMDVVGLAQHGFYGAVATLGTAFTQNHAKILFRETNSVVLCFDGDQAGQKAAIRTIKIVLPTLTANKKLRILTLENNKDPDDYIKEYGLEAFQNILDKALPVAEFLIKNFVGNRDLNTAQAKVEVLENLKAFLTEVEENIYSESIIATISDKVNIKIDQVKKILKIRKRIDSTIGQNLAVKRYNKQLKISKSLLLEQILLAEIFVNIEDFKELQKNTVFEIFSASQNLDILAKSLKILKEDTSNEVEAIILIQLLAEDYPGCREYFFEILSYGIENTLKKHAKEADYQKQIVDMLKRVENLSVKQQLKYLASLPLRTEIQEMERKYLVAKLGV